MSVMSFVQNVSEPLLSAAQALAPAFAEAAHRPLLEGDLALAIFVVSTALVGFACIYWACWSHARFGNFRIAVQQERAHNAAALLFRDVLLNRSALAVAVLKTANKDAQFFGEAQMLLEGCRLGLDGPALHVAISGLADKGTAFALNARALDGRLVEVRGEPVGDRAAIYLQDRGKDDVTRKYREILDALPMPVWLRESDMSLGWANRAFLSAIATENLANAVTNNAALEWSERDLSATVSGGRKPIKARRSAIVAGQRRMFQFNILPLDGAAVAGIATDITDTAKLEASLSLTLDAQSDVLEQIPFGIAVFDAGQRLVSYNSTYSRLWDLPEPWLDTHPSQEHILDRLRQSRRLPEQRNFAAWKKRQLEMFAGAMGESEELWHLPGGISVRVVIRPHLQGGMFVLLEDISERLRLESSMALLTQVQKATLDTIDEGIAIFGTDGRLTLHNGLFATMWRLAEDELSAYPHFDEIASICSTRIGRDGIWDVVSCGISAAAPERLGEWNKVRRADGRVISLAMSRLPNGATVVTFSDLTDLERFETLESGSLSSPGSAHVA